MKNKTCQCELYECCPICDAEAYKRNKKRFEEEQSAKPEETAEQRLDKLFDAGFSANHPAMLDWVAIKFELKRLSKIEIQFGLKMIALTKASQGISNLRAALGRHDGCSRFGVEDLILLDQTKGGKDDSAITNEAPANGVRDNIPTRRTDEGKPEGTTSGIKILREDGSLSDGPRDCPRGYY